MRKMGIMMMASVVLLNADPGRGETLHVYHVGNSLTASLTLDRLHELFAERGIDYQFGSQLSGGKSLIRHWNFHDEPNQKWVTWETIVPVGDTFDPDDNPFNKRPGKRFGYYETALTSNRWDAVVLQVYGSNLHDDLEAIGNFIDLAMQHNATRNFYIYETWPRRMPRKGPDGKFMRKHPENIDFAGVWTKPYEFALDDTSWQASREVPRRAYTKRLLAELKKRYPDVNIRVIPVGEVLYALDNAIKNDALPGLKAFAERKPEMVPGKDEDTDFTDGINVLYADGIHLNPMPHRSDTLGIYVSGTTVFSVLSGQNPVGMSGAPYGLDDGEYAELIKAIQQTIWDVVTAHPRTGLSR